MAVGGVLGFENCSTRSNLKIVKTEIHFNARIKGYDPHEIGRCVNS